MDDERLERVRRLCLALPEACETPEGRPAFRVRGKTFLWYMDDHHGDGRVAIWCKAPPGVQAARVAADPERCFVPPWGGRRAGWDCVWTGRSIGKT